MAKKKQTRNVKSISKKLSMISAIMLIISMIAAELIVIGFGYGMVKDLINKSLKTEVSTDAGMVNRDLNATFYYLNGVADTVEQMDFSDNANLRTYLEGTIGRYSMIPTGAYIALNDGTFIYPADPSIEAGFVPEEKAWYKEAMGYTDKYFYYYDVPYFDSATGDLCATVQRHVTLKDGREGAFVADLMMGSVQEKLNEVQIYDTGKAMMVTEDGLILSYEDTSICGKKIEEVGDDAFLNGVATVLQKEDGTVRKSVRK